MTKTYTPHKHAEAIKAWADGKPVEWREASMLSWQLIANPGFIKDYEYRIKPEEVVDYAVTHQNGMPGVVFKPTIACLVDFYSANNYQGFLKRTQLDGQVVSFEFIPK